MDEVLISIVTINYNHKAGLKNTLNSLANQTCKNFQLIIIDGNSNDGSKEIIANYSDIIDYSISEQDNGIYFAMNKGIKIAKCDFLIFLNSGDKLFSNNSIEKLNLNLLKKDFEDFLNAIIHNDKISHRSPKVFNKKYYKINNLFIPNHQAVIFPKTFYKKNFYETKYKVSSDVEYIFRLAKLHKLRYIDLDFVFFELGLVSNNFSNFSKTLNHLFEALQINMKYQPFKIYLYLYIPLKFISKYFLFNIFKNKFHYITQKFNVFK